jgi:uncharacterized membrane protein
MSKKRIDDNNSEKKPLIRKNSEAEDSKDEKGLTLVIAFVLMLIFQLGNRIFGRLQTFPMHNYPLFMNLLSNIIYIPICFMYIIPALYFYNVITKEQQEISKFKFLVMGGYDSLAGIMQTFAVNYISNSSTIVLVQQSAIPISMLISKITLQSVYTMPQYIGATVVLLGIVVVLIPTLFSSDASSTDSNNSELSWILVLVVSCVPMCLSSVYKEKALGEMEIDVIYLNGWVAVFQSLIAIPLCYPSAFVINIPFSNIFMNLQSGFYCWFGINTITEDYNPFNQPLDNCSNAPLFVSLYLAFNIVYNYLIVIILKHGSANILWMASTVIVPLSNVVFSLQFMPGHRDLNTFDIFGLFVIMFGLIIYRFTPVLHSAWNKITGKKVGREEIEEEKFAKVIAKKTERKQVKFVGLNQIEALQSLVDTRVLKEQKINLFRSPQQIRSSYLYKLGVPPSPDITVSLTGPPRLSFVESTSSQSNSFKKPFSQPTSSSIRSSIQKQSQSKSNSGGYQHLELNNNYNTIDNQNSNTIDSNL